VQTKPKQIGLNPQQRFRSIPWRIEVVNSQEPLPSQAAGLKPRQQRRLEIAEMQNTGWRWSEAAAITASLFKPAALIELVKEMVRTTH
jgi:NOL1/NOP2/fmu family ribosome biogenesis protein